MATLKEVLEMQSKLAKQMNDIYKGDGFKKFQEVTIGANKLVRDLGISSIINDNLGVISLSKIGTYSALEEFQKQSNWYKSLHEQSNWLKQISSTLENIKPTYMQIQEMNLAKISEVTKLIVPFSKLTNEYISSTLDFLDTSEINFESELVEEFGNISTQFEEILESPEVPEELHNSIINLKESINSMSDSEIKNKLIQMSNQFKVIETTIGTNGDSNTTVTFPPEVMNVFQSINDNMVNLANKIENYPNNPKSVNLIKQLITIIFWIVTSFIAGYISAFAADCYNTSHLHEKMTQQLSSPLETSQSLQVEKNKSDLASNNQSNHNE